MSLQIGQQLGSYEITSFIGKGGMGEVYRARDTRLKRDVAIKTLPDEVSRDTDRVARFQREAESLAALNHPNIAGIYDLQQNGDTRFLILEFVEGETIADILKKRGSLPVDEALQIAKQICEALEAAHERGIIHRDLKPANVKITPDGKVKVLDFGLAKAFAQETSNAALSDSPTLSMAATNAGVILGTAAYMSPEQAKGRTVDRRTDIFAFGALLYEMLTARPAFGGDDVQDVLSAVLKSEPEWSQLPSELSFRIPELLYLCLQKDAKKRRQTAADVRIDIEKAMAQPGVTAPANEPGRSSRLGWMAFSGALLAAVVVLAIPAVRYLRETPLPSPPETRTEIITPDTTDSISFALSPDGRQIVFVASGDGPSRLWLRSLASTTPQPLTGTEGAAYPFWKPDSRSVGFFAEGKLKRINIGGGAPQELAATGDRGGTWNADDVILFSPTVLSPLFRVPASGGEAVAVTKLDRQRSHRYPFFLPDGRQFLFYAQGTPESGGIYLGSLESGEMKRLTQADTAGVYLSSGWLLWVRSGALVAQRLDLQEEALTGDPVTLADPVGFDAVTAASAVSVSTAGLVAYRTGEANRRQLAWFDRAGKALGNLGEPDEDELLAPSISPRDGRVAVTRFTVQDMQQSNLDIWLSEGIRRSRFTSNAAADRFAIWSPDGSRIVFDSNRGEYRDLYQKSASGGAEEVLVKSMQNKVATDWSPDNRFILYQSIDAQTNWDIWVRPMDGSGKPWVFLNTGFEERGGQFSPNGRWVAYMSNESGPQEIYVRRFEVPTASGEATNTPGLLVSTEGGIFPRWRPDGNEIYYIGPNGEMMAVPITATETAMEPGAPVSLFPTRIHAGGVIRYEAPQYDISRDGRFLINTVLDDSSPITLIQNWQPPAK